MCVCVCVRHLHCTEIIMALIIRISLCICQGCVVWLDAHRPNLSVHHRVESDQEHRPWPWTNHIRLCVGSGPWWRKKTTLDSVSGDNGTITVALRCKRCLVKVAFTAKPEGKVNSGEEERNNNKEQDLRWSQGPKPQITIWPQNEGQTAFILLSTQGFFFLSLLQRNSAVPSLILLSSHPHPPRFIDCSSLLITSS